jgi:hypothetical protein
LKELSSLTESVLSTIPSINKGLLSALLPITFIEDFKLYSNRIILYLIDDIVEILPRVEAFLDALSELTETELYLEMVTPRKGILKTYGVPELSFNPRLLFENDETDFYRGKGVS